MGQQEIFRTLKTSALERTLFHNLGQNLGIKTPLNSKFDQIICIIRFQIHEFNMYGRNILLMRG